MLFKESLQLRIDLLQGDIYIFYLLVAPSNLLKLPHDHFPALKIIATDASVNVCKIIHHERLLATLHTGEIYLGSIGHPDFSKLNILGDTVNIAFLMNRWATQETTSNLIVSNETWQCFDFHLESKIEKAEIPRLKKAMILHTLIV